nr:MAG TPA: Neuropeptide K, 3 10 helix, lipid [Caudoviricetes sp.]
MLSSLSPLNDSHKRSKISSFVTHITSSFPLLTIFHALS